MGGSRVTGSSTSLSRYEKANVWDSGSKGEGWRFVSEQAPRLDEVAECCPRNVHNLSDGRYAYFLLQQQSDLRLFPVQNLTVDIILTESWWQLA